jgi:hypothetical protein
MDASSKTDDFQPATAAQVEAFIARWEHAGLDPNFSDNSGKKKP